MCVSVACFLLLLTAGAGTSTAPSGCYATRFTALPSPCPQHHVIEAPYYEVVQRIGDQAAQALDPNAGFVVATGTRPGGSEINARLMSKPATEHADYGVVDFCPTAVLTVGAAITDTLVTIGSGSMLNQVAVGSWAQMGSEIVRVDVVTSTTLTIGRGCLDTVPVAHAPGTRVFFSDVFLEADSIEYATGETARVKLLPVSGLGQLPLVSASEQTVTMARRQYRPYPPGRLRINGDAYPATASGSTITVAWAHRDRLLQTAGSISDTEAGNIGPEAGTTYTVEIRRADNNTLLASQAGISGTSATLTPGYVGSVRIIVKSTRDGVESWQNHVWVVMLT